MKHEAKQKLLSRTVSSPLNCADCGADVGKKLCESAHSRSLLFAENASISGDLRTNLAGRPSKLFVQFFFRVLFVVLHQKVSGPCGKLLTSSAEQRLARVLPRLAKPPESPCGSVISHVGFTFTVGDLVAIAGRRGIESHVKGRLRRYCLRSRPPYSWLCTKSLKMITVRCTRRVKTLISCAILHSVAGCISAQLLVRFFSGGAGLCLRFC
jgi:hypothetical protein